jgi:uncharacterized protein (DUF2164 family)
MCMSWNKSSNYTNMHGATIKKYIIKYIVVFLTERLFSYYYNRRGWLLSNSSSSVKSAVK